MPHTWDLRRCCRWPRGWCDEWLSRVSNPRPSVCFVDRNFSPNDFVKLAITTSHPGMQSLSPPASPPPSVSSHPRSGSGSGSGVGPGGESGGSATADVSPPLPQEASPSPPPFFAGNPQLQQRARADETSPSASGGDLAGSSSPVSATRHPQPARPYRAACKVDHGQSPPSPQPAPQQPLPFSYTPDFDDGGGVRAVLGGGGNGGEGGSCTTTYIGQLNECNKFHGVGSIVWPDGRKYVGQWRDGVIEGAGHMRWEDGSAYRGDFKDGLVRRLAPSSPSSRATRGSD